MLIYGKKDEKRRYSAWHILNEFKSVSGIETEKLIDELLQGVTENEIYFKASLKELLEGPFSGNDKERKPVLLVIDDLEKIGQLGEPIPGGIPKVRGKMLKPKAM